VIPQRVLFEYLRNTATMTPVPVTLFAFSSRLSCDEKQRLQALILETSMCGPTLKPCIEGTDAEYKGAFGRR